MAKLKISHSHELGRDEALERLQRFIELAKAQYGSHVNDLQETWHEEGLDFSFRAMGFSTNGTLRVEATEVHLNSHLPLAAIVFKGKIEDGVRKQLERVLC